MVLKPQRKDLVWSYLGQVFSIVSSLLVLPVILRVFSPAEVGMNYVFITLTGFISLLDFGFSSQFSRTVAFVYGGLQSLSKEGLDVQSETKSAEVNYKLLVNLVDVAKSVYRILAIVAVLILSSVGTFYVHRVTKGFTNVNNVLPVWGVYIVSTYFNIYYLYLRAILIGKGKIAESRRAMVLSRIAYILVALVLVILKFGLLSIAIANFIAPIIERVLSYKGFFDVDFLNQRKIYISTNKEKADLFRTLWHNSRKVGLVTLSAFAVNKIGIFYAGLYLSLEEVGSYGLMVQILRLISVVSSTFFSIYQPRFASLRIKSKKEELMNEFSFTMAVFYVLFIAACFFLILFGPNLLILIKSNSRLPDLRIIIIYSIIVFLEQNHSNFATFITTSNSIPFVKASIISGVLVAVGSFYFTAIHNYGILGLVVVPGVVQAAYSNWKWPSMVLNEFSLSISGYLRKCLAQLFSFFKKIGELINGR